jgi:hypothetical protein
MKKTLLNIVIVVFLLLAVYSCIEQPNNPVKENKPPETNVALFPDNVENINQQKSRLEVHWWGEDPDGIILGYYFRWVGLSKQWNFTTTNDSLFSLPIGSADTTYEFEVMAVDVQGNHKYDNSVIWNGEDIGPEPFIDNNNNGQWDEGEFYYDIGMIDPTPATMKFPIKNTAPEVEWRKESIIPEETLPVITVAWNATDLDGNGSIVSIDLAINDMNNAVKLPGNTRLVTLRVTDTHSQNPEMEILINGSEEKIFDKKLSGLKLNDFNRLYIKATDISGSSSEIISLPDTGRTWFVKKVKGELLIIDDFESGDDAGVFYDSLFSSIDNGNFANKFDVFDIEKTKLPYQTITFYQTMKLYKFIYWYADATPSLDLASAVTQNYLIGGGKIAYSLTLQPAGTSFPYDLATLQSFLPIESFDEGTLNFMFPGADVLPLTGFEDYPQLKTASTIGYVNTFIPRTAKGIHNLSAKQIKGIISMITDDKTLFFIGLPLHQINKIDGSVKTLVEKVFIEEFGM